MATYNRIVLLGNLTRDIELKRAGNTPVVNAGLAVDGQRRSESRDALFVDLTFWGRTAEVAALYLEKGDLILVEGHLERDSWEKDGEPRSRLFVHVDRLQMLGGSKPPASVQPPAEEQVVAQREGTA